MSNELAEIRSLLFGMKQDMGEMRGDVRSMRETITDRGTKLDKLTTRVGKVENRQHYWMGGGSLAGLLVGLWVRVRYG